ncbi:MAG: hypothetical protein AMXMBFR79_04700 [Chitinophagaceae bacterium]|nr:LytTR family transcriptional regulator DNA-binding domain-containing protein [Chitinophagales bacterium]
MTRKTRQILHFNQNDNSFIINKNQIKKYVRTNGGQIIMQGDVMLPISKRKKTDFLKDIKGVSWWRKPFSGFDL